MSGLGVSDQRNHVTRERHEERAGLRVTSACVQRFRPVPMLPKSFTVDGKRDVTLQRSKDGFSRGDRGVGWGTLAGVDGRFDRVDQAIDAIGYRQRGHRLPHLS